MAIFTFFFFATTSGYIGFTFQGYMLFAAMEQWQWIKANYYDEVFGWLFVNIESNIVYSLLVAPVKELMSAFLFLEEENRFSPMNEY